MKHGYYLDQSKKLEKSLATYLQKLKKPLLQRYGEKKTDSIIEKSAKYYPDIIQKMRHGSNWDRITLANSVRQ